MKFILVRTVYSSNLGSTARALKTMGFQDLVLVQPEADPSHERARTLAIHSEDILDGVVICDSLQEALSDVDISVAATHRFRKTVKTIVSSRNLKTWLEDKGERVALVLGPESTGLNLKELSQCDAFVTIPTETSQPSLNLAQAVMVLAYELSNTQGQSKPARVRRREEREVKPGEFLVLKNRIIKILDQLNLDPAYYLSRFGELNRNDLCLLHDLTRRVDEKINN